MQSDSVFLRARFLLFVNNKCEKLPLGIKSFNPKRLASMIIFSAAFGGIEGRVPPYPQNPGSKVLQCFFPEPPIFFRPSGDPPPMAHISQVLRPHNFFNHAGRLLLCM